MMLQQSHWGDPVSSFRRDVLLIYITSIYLHQSNSWHWTKEEFYWKHLCTSELHFWVTFMIFYFSSPMNYIIGSTVKFCWIGYYWMGVFMYFVGDFCVFHKEFSVRHLFYMLQSIEIRNLISLCFMFAAGLEKMNQWIISVVCIQICNVHGQLIS